MHLSYLAYIDWNHLWVKLDIKYFDYFIDMICALVLSRLELLLVKFDTKYLDYFIEMIEYAVLQAEFVSKCYLPNLRAICLYKIFNNIHIKSELRMNFPKNCYLSKNERKDRNLSSG